MEPQQINPTSAPASDVNKQTPKNLSRLLIYSLFTLIIFGLLLLWNYPIQVLSFFGVTNSLCIPDCGVNFIPIVDETDAWKTYRNEEYGFEVKIPQDWEVRKESRVNNGDELYFISKNRLNLIEEEYKKCKDCLNYGPDPYELSFFPKNFEKDKDLGQAVLNGITWNKYLEYGGNAITNYEFTQGGETFSFGVDGYGKEAEKVVEKILSTFKFIDSTTTDISTWKAYRNEEYGFEFKYPEDWVEVKWGLLTIDKDYVPNPQRQAHNFNGFCKIVFHDKFSLENGIQEAKDLSLDFIPSEPLSTSTISIANKKGIKLITNFRPAIFTYYLLLEKGKTLSISLNCGDDVKEKGEDILSQILSTFKFIDKTDISTWKTYRNEELGFEFKYPKDWEGITSNITRTDSKLLLFTGALTLNSTSSPEMGEVNLPPVGGMWLSVLPVETCDDSSLNNINSDFSLMTDLDIATKSICSGPFKMGVGLWEPDPDFNDHRIILNKILSTFKFTK